MQKERILNDQEIWEVIFASEVGEGVVYVTKLDGDLANLKDQKVVLVDLPYNPDTKKFSRLVKKIKAVSNASIFAMSTEKVDEQAFIANGASAVLNTFVEPDELREQISKILPAHAA